MKLNKEKFMKTEMGGELEETIRTWDKAIDERRKATPGIGNPDQGLGFKYWDNTCRSCQFDVCRGIAVQDAERCRMESEA